MLTKTVSMYDREEYLRHLYSGEVNSKRVQEENERRKEVRVTFGYQPSF